MKIADIPFEDEAFKACVLATGAEQAEEVKRLECRKKGIESVAGIEYLTNLKLIDLTRNEISKIDLSKNVELEEAFLGNNELTELDVSGCSKLTYLEVFINQLEVLDLSNNPLLETLCANKNDLESLDLSKNPELVDLRLSSNELESLDLSSNSKLERVELDMNPLSEDAKAQIQQLNPPRLAI